MPDVLSWLSEYEFEYLRLYETYERDGMTERQMKELNEIARLLYPPVSETLGHGNDHVMIKAAYRIIVTGLRKPGYLLLTNKGTRWEYMTDGSMSSLRSTCTHHRERRYRDFEAYEIKSLLYGNGYHFNEGLKTRRLEHGRRFSNGM